MAPLPLFLLALLLSLTVIHQGLAFQPSPLGKTGTNLSPKLSLAASPPILPLSGPPQSSSLLIRFSSVDPKEEQDDLLLEEEQDKNEPLMQQLKHKLQDTVHNQVTPRAKSAAQWTRTQLDQVKPRARRAREWIRDKLPSQLPTRINGSPASSVNGGGGHEKEQEDDPVAEIPSFLEEATTDQNDQSPQRVQATLDKIKTNVSAKVDRATEWVQSKKNALTTKSSNLVSKVGDSELVSKFRQQPVPVQVALLLAGVSVPTAAIVSSRMAALSGKKTATRVLTLALAAGAGTWVGRAIHQRRQQEETESSTPEFLLEKIAKDQPPQLVRTTQTEEETAPPQEATIEKEEESVAGNPEQDRLFVQRILDRVQKLEMPSQQQKVVKRLKDRVAHVADNVAEKLHVPTPNNSNKKSTATTSSSTAVYLEDLSQLQQHNSVVRDRLSSFKKAVLPSTPPTSTASSYLDGLSSRRSTSSRNQNSSWFGSKPQQAVAASTTSYLESLPQQHAPPRSQSVSVSTTSTAPATPATTSAAATEMQATPEPVAASVSKVAEPTASAQATPASSVQEKVKKAPVPAAPSKPTAPAANRSASTTSMGRRFPALMKDGRYKKARQQPKSAAEEEALRNKYASIPSVEDRAFQVLSDLGMVEKTASKED